MLQSLPLEVKIAKTLIRIREFVEFYGEDKVYISFSGGKDSTVLVHLVRSIYPNIECVFSNTGLEFPEVVSFVKTFDNITIVRPDRTFRDVIFNEGYPVVSKKVSMMIKRIKAPQSKNIYCRQLFLNGTKKDGSQGSRASMLPQKHRYLLDAPFDISDECCKILKKKPLREYQKKTGKYPIKGVMAAECDTRTVSYLSTGCNSFSKDPSSQPLGFWTEQDVLAYIYLNHITIASVYGDVIINKDGKYQTTGEQRTGCVFCALGCQYDSKDGGETRFQRLKRTHPQLHDYCMHDLGFAKVLDYVGVEWN